jgi:hypothetical protein
MIEPSLFGQKAPDPRAQIPNLLIQVVDRVEQVRSIHSALQANHVAKGKVSRPLVFVLLGSSADGPEGLPQLYRDDILPAYLAAPPMAPRSEFTRMKWPPGGSTLASLKQDLATELLLERTAGDDRIRMRLTDGVGARLIAHSIGAWEFAPADTPLLLAWIDHWANHPEGAAGKIVTLFVCLQYATGLMGLKQRLAMDRVYARILHEFEGRPEVTCLPRLTPIHRGHVVDWATDAVQKRSSEFDASLLKASAMRPFGRFTRQLRFDALSIALRDALVDARTGRRPDAGTRTP